MLYCPGYKAFLAVPGPNSICFFSLFNCNLLFPQLCSSMCLSIQTLTLISELSIENKKKERKEVGFGWGFFLLK